MFCNKFYSILSRIDKTKKCIIIRSTINFVQEKKTPHNSRQLPAWELSLQPQVYTWVSGETDQQQYNAELFAEYPEQHVYRGYELDPQSTAEH